MRQIQTVAFISNFCEKSWYGIRHLKGRKKGMDKATLPETVTFFLSKHMEEFISKTLILTIHVH